AAAAIFDLLPNTHSKEGERRAKVQVHTDKARNCQLFGVAAERGPRVYANGLAKSRKRPQRALPGGLLRSCKLYKKKFGRRACA
ncbi:hypothetical protein pipiens_020429, partial [Culex pipiens pipiens]